jgi:hypothetical protein
MKYPSTLHIPSSPGLTQDDSKLKSLECLLGKEVIITEKLDGENMSFHKGGYHARSEDSRTDISRNQVARIFGSISHLIPENLQIVGENVYAKHSISYDHLTSFFYVFGIIDKDMDVFLSVEETLRICKELDLSFVPVLFKGIYDGNFKIPEKSIFGEEIEGYVVRVVSSFPVSQFQQNVAKWVRAGHVKSEIHWKKNWTPNKKV